MRRRSANPPNSLDLLLDTITNAFGGILFLAILVVLLLQMSRRHWRADEATSRPASAQRLEQLQAEIAVRRRTRATQQELLSRHSPDRASELLAQAGAARDRREQLEDQRERTELAIAELESEIGEAEGVPANLVAALEEARERLTAEQEALQSEIASRQQSARLPRLRSSEKIEVAAVLRYNRFYLVHRPSDLRFLFELNTDDFVVTHEDEEDITLTPKPYAGLVVDETEQFQSLLRQRLAEYDHETVYLAVCTWSDSFGSFVHLKNALIECGFEYRLILASPGDSLTQGHVGDPQVQ